MTLDNYDFSGKRALIRVDFNVPLDAERNVTDRTRIKAAIPTIQTILDKGGSCVLMSHLGRPKGSDPELSMQHIVSAVSEELGREVVFAGDCISDEAKSKSAALQPGQVLLLDNLRFHKEEKAGDEFFAGQLAEHGDVWVNDAFGTAHRAHASTAIIARFFPHDKLFGRVMENEITNIDKVVKHPESPVTAIIGGAKVSSKITILANLIGKVDHIIVGGGMAYTFYKAQGGNVGNSLVEDDFLENAKEVLATAEAKGTTIHLPADSIAADKFDNEATTVSCPSDNIPAGYMGLDIGDEARKHFEEIIHASKTVLWNGPMGVFEMSNFANGTIQAAKALAAATSHGTFTLVGGGDSVAAINQFNLADQVSYVSTGGGAMLEYLEGKELPGIAAVRS